MKLDVVCRLRTATTVCKREFRFSACVDEPWKILEFYNFKAQEFVKSRVATLLQLLAASSLIGLLDSKQQCQTEVQRKRIKYLCAVKWRCVQQQNHLRRNGFLIQHFDFDDDIAHRAQNCHAVNRGSNIEQLGVCDQQNSKSPHEDQSIL